MSRGGYTSAIDMWSAGCIFGELLQRVARMGSATTPHLQVAPLFAIHGIPKTPSEGCAAPPHGRVFRVEHAWAAPRRCTCRSRRCLPSTASQDALRGVRAPRVLGFCRVE